MAFFKFRKNGPSGQDVPSPRGEAAAPAETVENLRRRALYRLIGAAVLVLIAIIGFPMLFDNQPRPVAVQAPIIIPDRNAAPPLTPPASVATVHTASAPVPPITPIAPQVPASASLATGEEMVAPASSGQMPAAIVASDIGSATLTPQAAQNVRPKQQTEKQSTAKQQAAKNAAEKRKADDQAKRQLSQADAARALALLNGQNAAPAATPSSGSAFAHDTGAHAGGRYVIQIGAFANAQSAQAARQKAGHAGVNAYTQTVATSAGSRTRVRAGPFASRDEAERALAKLKQAGLGGNIVSP